MLTPVSAVPPRKTWRIFSKGTPPLESRQQLESRLFMLATTRSAGSPQVNIRAFAALGTIGSIEIIPDLMTFPRGNVLFENPEVRAAWLEALTEVVLREGNKETVESLYRTHQLRGLAGDSYMHEGAIGVLGKMAASGNLQLAYLAKNKIETLWCENWEGDNGVRYSRANPYVLAELVRQTSDIAILQDFWRLAKKRDAKLWKKEEDNQRGVVVWKALFNKFRDAGIPIESYLSMLSVDLSPKSAVLNRTVPDPVATLRQNGQHLLVVSLSAVKKLLSNGYKLTSRDINLIFESLEAFFAHPAELRGEEEVLALLPPLGTKEHTGRTFDFLWQQLNSLNPQAQGRAALALKFYFEPQNGGSKWLQVG